MSESSKKVLTMEEFDMYKKRYMHTVRLPYFIRQWIRDKDYTFSEAVRIALYIDTDISDIDEELGKKNVNKKKFSVSFRLSEKDIDRLVHECIKYKLGYSSVIRRKLIAWYKEEKEEEVIKV